ncbi:hypothetical protein MNBD_GAMMA17-299 [hydrothermal vent metagenome]|uniref:DUF4350 domain-containing protein n=1 Tax=hydrothermal vent metagenome TaxID=652676 RepID=A0A3B0ZKJ9_9ZZZZ
MSPRNRNALWGVLICLSFTAGGYWFLVNFERVEELYTTSAGREARKNPFLAAERFLWLNGIQTESWDAAQLMETLPESNNVLFIPDHRATGVLTPERQEMLVDWMRNGGHLIMVARELWDEERESSGDDFLDAFGIQQYRRSREDMGPEKRQKEEMYIETRFAGHGESLKVGFMPQYYMIDSEERVYAGIEGERGYHLLQFALGNGYLTVLSDDLIWHNHSIGNHDNAFFLRNLVHSEQESARSELWIVRNLEFPSLLALIWQHAHYALLALGLLIIFALWAAYNRFGPTIVLSHHIRRSLIEHLDACGRYHWQQNRGGALLTALREQLQQLFEKRHPGWQQISRVEQLEWLAQRSKISQRRLSAALREQPQGEAEFTQIVQTIQRLRKTL